MSTKEQLAAIKTKRGLLTTKEAAAYMNVSVSAVDKLRRRGAFQTISYGKSIRFERSDIDTYIESCKFIDETEIENDNWSE